jgi:hypothetical protein
LLKGEGDDDDFADFPSPSVIALASSSDML